MTLNFTHKLLPNSSEGVFGCLQMCEEPEKFEEVKWTKKHCRTCKSLLFPLKQVETKFDCPICHPDAEYSEKTFKLQKQGYTRKLLFFLFDITIPIEVLNFLLTDLYNNLKEDEKVLLACLSDRIMFISVSHGLMQIDTFSTSQDIKTAIKDFISKEDLKNIIIPSITSIFSLFPENLQNIYDYYDAFKGCVKLSLNQPFTIILYSNRHCDSINADDAFYLSNIVSQHNSVIHVGCSFQIKRITAGTRAAFGTVFMMSEVPEKSILPKLEWRNPLSKFRIFAPSAFEYTKVTNSSGNLRMSSRLAKLKLNNFKGGSVMMAFDRTRVKSQTIKLIEEVRTANGTYISCHSLGISKDQQEFTVSANADILRSVILKCFASDVLRNIWDCQDTTQTIAKFLPKVEQYTKDKTSLSKFGINEDIELLRLYYVLNSYGVIDIDVKIIEKDGILTLLVPPVMYVYDPEDTMKYMEIWDSIKWPFTIEKVKSRDALQLLCDKFSIKLPSEETNE